MTTSIDELKLDFDSADTKSVSLDNNFMDSLSFISPSGSPNRGDPNITEKNEPKLNVSNTLGVEYLARGGNIPKSEENTEKPRIDEFSFFKAEEKTETPFKSDEETDKLLIESKDNRQTIHSMSPQEIKNEKIDMIYKFKKLENQGIRTTMNYNMNSPLDDMRNEYMKLKKQREIENSVKFQRKMMMAMITGV